jgi:Bacterial Ig domain
VGGALVQTAPPGATITLVASTRDLNGDPLQHEWITQSGNGSVAGAVAGFANWQLPNFAGRYSAYVQVSDGRGGFARQRIDFITARTDTTFAGIAVEKGTGTRLKGAAVMVNGQTTTTDVNGFFSAKTPLTDRYVLTIAREGYATFSRVVDSGLTGQTWPLVKAQSETVDPKQPIDLVDRRPELERKKMRGTRIHVPANALISPTGAAPTGVLTAYMATLITADGEARGDWGAMLAGQETNLISYGAVFVEFRAAAGVKYNLAPGMSAQVEMFAPQSMLPAAPANSRLWSYDETDGYWKQSGNANLVAGNESFEGKVSHFSTINTDLEKNQAACLKTLIYPPIPTGVRLRVTDPTGTILTQSFEFVLDAGINAVYRLPSKRMCSSSCSMLTVARTREQSCWRKCQEYRWRAISSTPAPRSPPGRPSGRRSHMKLAS